MLNFFDLFDLHGIFVNVRNSKCNPLNEEIVHRTLQVIKSRNSDFEINQFRTALNSLDLSNHPEYLFVSIQNAYPHIPYLIKEEKVYRLLESACKDLLAAIGGHSYNQVEDLADALHNLPLLLAEHQLSIPESYWNHEIKWYRKKWNKNISVTYKIKTNLLSSKFIFR